MKKNKTYLGSDEDYVMTSAMSRFDEYTIFDIMGIESDLKYILFHKDLSREYKTIAKCRYKQVINYIEDRIREREKNVKSNSKTKP